MKQMAYKITSISLVKTANAQCHMQEIHQHMNTALAWRILQELCLCNFLHWVLLVELIMHSLYAFCYIACSWNPYIHLVYWLIDVMFEVIARCRCHPLFHCSCIRWYGAERQDRAYTAARYVNIYNTYSMDLAYIIIFWAPGFSTMQPIFVMSNF